jgi:hypothetical protein
MRNTLHKYQLAVSPFTRITVADTLLLYNCCVTQHEQAAKKSDTSSEIRSENTSTSQPVASSASHTTDVANDSTTTTSLDSGALSSYTDGTGNGDPKGIKAVILRYVFARIETFNTL